MTIIKPMTLRWYKGSDYITRKGPFISVTYPTFSSREECRAFHEKWWAFDVAPWVTRNWPALEYITLHSNYVLDEWDWEMDSLYTRKFGIQLAYGMVFHRDKETGKLTEIM